MIYNNALNCILSCQFCETKVPHFKKVFTGISNNLKNSKQMFLNQGLGKVFSCTGSFQIADLTIAISSP